MSEVGDLTRLHEKYYSRGFRVVALSNEPADLIRAEVVEKRGAKYWLGSDSQDKTLARFVDGGQIGIPRFYLVDAKGKVVGHSVPSETRIEELLAQVFEAKIERTLAPALADARAAYERQDFGAAWKLAGESLAAEDRALAADALWLRQHVERYAALRRESVEATLAGQRDPVAYGALLDLQHRFAGTEAAAWAKARRKELDGRDAIKSERPAWKTYEEALERELRAKGVDWQLANVAKTYERLVEKHPESAAAKLGRAALERIAATKAGSTR